MAGPSACLRSLNRVPVAACCAMLWSVTTGLAADHAQNRNRCPCAGLNYDRNIVQFYGVCLQEGSPPMLICEVQQPSLPRRHLARPPFLQSHCRCAGCPYGPYRSFPTSRFIYHCNCLILLELLRGSDQTHGRARALKGLSRRPNACS